MPEQVRVGQIGAGMHALLRAPGIDVSLSPPPALALSRTTSSMLLISISHPTLPPVPCPPRPLPSLPGTYPELTHSTPLLSQAVNVRRDGNSRRRLFGWTGVTHSGSIMNPTRAFRKKRYKQPHRPFIQRETTKWKYTEKAEEREKGNGKTRGKQLKRGHITGL